MDISFEGIRGTGLSGKSILKAYLQVRMQKKDIHIPHTARSGKKERVFKEFYTGLKEAMTVSERRYLKRNSNKFCSDQIFGVYSSELIEVCTFLCKLQIFDHMLIN